MNQCCAIGMVPLTLESEAENTCFKKMISTVIDLNGRGDLIIAFNRCAMAAQQ